MRIDPFYSIIKIHQRPHDEKRSDAANQWQTTQMILPHNSPPRLACLLAFLACGHLPKSTAIGTNDGQDDGEIRKLRSAGLTTRVIFLHIHKCAGSFLCSLAKANGMTTPNARTGGELGLLEYAAS